MFICVLSFQFDEIVTTALRKSQALRFLGTQTRIFFQRYTAFRRPETARTKSAHRCLITGRAPDTCV